MNNLYPWRRKIATCLGALFILFSFSAFSESHQQAGKGEIETQITAISGSSVPALLDHSTGKSEFQHSAPKLSITAAFIHATIIDCPSAEISTNVAQFVNSYAHNVFYVLLTAKAP